MKRAIVPALLFVLVLWAGLFLPRQDTSPQTLPRVQNVVLLLAPGASLADWQSADTPTLHALVANQKASVAVVPTRAGGNETLADALTMLAHGRRSADDNAPNLGETLDRAQIKTILLDGEDVPQSRLIVGPNARVVPPRLWCVSDPNTATGSATDPERLAQQLKDIIKNGADTLSTLAVAYFEDLYIVDRNAPLCLPQVTARQRRRGLQRLDQIVARLTAPTETGGLSTNTALLIVTPLPSTVATEHTERLGPVLLWTRLGSQTAPAVLLSSPSTRRTPGLVAATDVAVTVTALLGLPSQTRIGDGRPAAVVPGTFATLQTRVTGWSRQSREQKLLVAVPWLLAALSIVAYVLRRTDQTRIIAFILAFAVTVPMALWLAPVLTPGVVTAWPGTVYLVAALLCAISGCATRFADVRCLLRFIAFLTVCVAVLDLTLGSRFLPSSFLARSPLSYSVLEAARFYGLGNESSGVLLGAALASAPLLGGALLPLVLWAFAVLLAAVLPALGADAGSAIGGLAGWGTLIIQAVPAQRRRTTVIIIALASLLLVTGYVAWEGSRGQSRTHVGQLVSAARQSGTKPVWEIARRKLAVNARLSVTSPWAVLLYTEIAFSFLLRRHLSALSPSERAALFAQYAGAGALYIANDSGVVAAATCLLFAVPLLLTTKQGELKRPLTLPKNM